MFVFIVILKRYVYARIHFFYFIIYRYSECTVISKFAGFNFLQYIDVLIQPKDKIVNYTF